MTAPPGVPLLSATPTNGKWLQQVPCLGAHSSSVLWLILEALRLTKAAAGCLLRLGTSPEESQAVPLADWDGPGVPGRAPATALSVRVTSPARCPVDLTGLTALALMSLHKEIGPFFTLECD